MVPLVIAFLVPFGAVIAVLALSGRCFVAIWSVAPVCGGDYWFDICTSPELLIFAFFMMTDPKTAPRDALGRACMP